MRHLKAFPFALLTVFLPYKHKPTPQGVTTYDNIAFGSDEENGKFQNKSAVNSRASGRASSRASHHVNHDVVSDHRNSIGSGGRGGGEEREGGDGRVML